MFTGSQIKPSITIKDGTKTLKNGTDYTVSYGKNTSLGKGTVKSVGKGLIPVRFQKHLQLANEVLPH